MFRYSEKLHFPRLDRKRVRSKRVPPAARAIETSGALRTNEVCLIVTWRCQTYFLLRKPLNQKS